MTIATELVRCKIFVDNKINNDVSKGQPRQVCTRAQKTYVAVWSRNWIREVQDNRQVYVTEMKIFIKTAGKARWSSVRNGNIRKIYEITGIITGWMEKMIRMWVVPNW